MSQSPLLRPCPCSGASPTLMPSALAPGCRDSSPGCLLGQGFWCLSQFTQLAGTLWGRPRVCVHWEREPGHLPQWPVGQEPPHPTPGQTLRAICNCVAGRAAPTCGLQARHPAVSCITVPSLSACGKPVTSSFGCLVFRGAHVPS